MERLIKQGLNIDNCMQKREAGPEAEQRVETN